MNDKNPIIKELFHKWFEGTITENEERVLEILVKSEDFDRHLPELLLNEWNSLKASEDFSLQDRRRLGLAITSLFPAQPAEDNLPESLEPILRPMRKWWWAAAAAVVLTAGATAYFFVSNTSTQEQLSQSSAGINTPVIPPGKDGAILLLADGSLISLDTADNGLIALQGGATAQLVNGVLQYVATGNEAVHNTMRTPMGRQFHLILPDGSKVWLNSASSIRFPTVFNAKERKVEITGEVYFEVESDVHHPFFVKLNEQTTLQVIGTSFNVNAYSDEPLIKTTLLDGNLHVVNNNITFRLNPGEQLRIADSHDAKIIKGIDTEEVIAWKNGYFNLQSSDLPAMVRQMSRWYNIKISIEGSVPDKKFGGFISCDINLNDLLKAMQDYGIYSDWDEQQLRLSFKKRK